MQKPAFYDYSNTVQYILAYGSCSVLYCVINLTLFRVHLKQLGRGAVLDWVLTNDYFFIASRNAFKTVSITNVASLQANSASLLSCPAVCASIANTSIGQPCAGAFHSFVSWKRTSQVLARIGALSARFLANAVCLIGRCTKDLLVTLASCEPLTMLGGANAINKHREVHVDLVITNDVDHRCHCGWRWTCRWDSHYRNTGCWKWGRLGGYSIRRPAGCCRWLSTRFTRLGAQCHGRMTIDTHTALPARSVAEPAAGSLDAIINDKHHS